MEDKKTQLLIEFKIPSISEKGQMHIIKIYSDGNIVCDCIAYKMKKVKICRHQKVAIKTLESLIKRIKERYETNLDCNY